MAQAVKRTTRRCTDCGYTASKCTCTPRGAELVKATAAAAMAGVTDEYMTVPAVAVRLRVSKRTVHNLCHRGDLDWTFVGNQMRIDPQSVEDYLARGHLRASNAVKAAEFHRARRGSA